MTRYDLIHRLSKAIAEHEGYYVTEKEARDRGIKYPTRAQRQYNPGNIRKWKDRAGMSYPRTGGYVDFMAWAVEQWPNMAFTAQRQNAEEEGWRVLGALVGQYLLGQYTGNGIPTLRQMFAVYAPAADGNDPDSYARVVGLKVGIGVDVPLSTLLDEGER